MCFLACRLQISRLTTAELIIASADVSESRRGLGLKIINARFVEVFSSNQRTRSGYQWHKCSSRHTCLPFRRQLT
ncbi:hypothetical protein PHJA_001874200 [Phtheirospermum japonicum]|uniref:Uncharacterized protein n=1 Tax=Phtheirospermum japonicum TaxID=374723 RepID=A0A830CSE3_9LAMI|nr:hypothetical protein PHJA_001874200 [Phtheirospermum japonicum]